jgi:hypothetical protein
MTPLVAASLLTSSRQNTRTGREPRQPGGSAELPVTGAPGPTACAASRPPEAASRPPAGAASRRQSSQPPAGAPGYDLNVTLLLLFQQRPHAHAAVLGRRRRDTPRSLTGGPRRPAGRGTRPFPMIATTFPAKTRELQSRLCRPSRAGHARVASGTVGAAARGAPGRWKRLRRGTLASHPPEQPADAAGRCGAASRRPGRRSGGWPPGWPAWVPAGPRRRPRPPPLARPARPRASTRRPSSAGRRTR